MAKRKAKFEKLSVNIERRGTVRFETAYGALEAAKIATKWAKQGWTAEVQSWRSLGTRRNILMSCRGSSTEFSPKYRGAEKLYAKCTMSPAFKKRIQRR